MKYFRIVALGFITCSTTVSANCVPPMQTLLACTFEDSDTRVEFCHEIAKPERTEGSNIYSSEWGDAMSYSLVRGFAPAELYFTPTSNYFAYADATPIDKKIYGSSLAHFLAVGFENVDYVYAAVIGVDELYGGVYGGEVRVYENVDDFSDMQSGKEVGRYFCSQESLIVNDAEIRP